MYNHYVIIKASDKDVTREEYARRMRGISW